MRGRDTAALGLRTDRIPGQGAAQHRDVGGSRTGAVARALIQDHQAKVNELLRRFYR